MRYDKVRQAFEMYLKNYDRDNKKIAMKIHHSYNVVKLSEIIAKDLDLDDKNIELAKIIAQLHDLGRFEQIKQYDTFNDNVSIDHGDYAVRILFREGRIRNFVDDAECDDIIMKAIKNHNKFAIEEDLTDAELLHSKIIRDADKLEILSSRCARLDMSYIGDFMQASAIEVSKMTDAVFDNFFNNRQNLKSEIKNGLDEWVVYFNLILDLNFNFSIRYLVANDFVNRMVNKFHYKESESRERIEAIRDYVDDYIGQRMSSMI